MERIDPTIDTKKQQEFIAYIWYQELYPLIAHL